MRLSEMKTKDAFKAIAKLLPVAKEIAKDEKILDIWYRRLDLTLGATEQEHKKEKAVYAIDKFGDLIPYILENHDKNVFKILAILNGKTPREIEEQGFVEVMVQLADALNDEALVKLFTM